MPTIVIRILGLADGSDDGCAGQWVHSFCPDGHNGTGDLVLTSNVAEAKRYDNAGDAIADWQAVSKTHPERPDGKPNRPMTAFTVEIGVPTP